MVIRANLCVGNVLASWSVHSSMHEKLFCILCLTCPTMFGLCGTSKFLCGLCWSGGFSFIFTRFLPQRSGSSWLRVAPFGMRNILNWARQQYGDIEFTITENGFSDQQGNLDDLQRIYYYKHCINQILKGKCSFFFLLMQAEITVVLDTTRNSF